MNTVEPHCFYICTIPCKEFLKSFSSGDIPKNYVVTNLKSVIFVLISCVSISTSFWVTMTIKWSKTISWIGRIHWCALKVRARNCARENYVLFSHENIFLWLKGGLGVIKSMDNLLNFSRLIMMKRENPFHIDKTISFLYHETRVRALVRAKGLKIWIMKKFLFKTFFTYTGIIFHL